MATCTISPAGGKWSETTTWVGGVVPTSSDDVVATAESGNLTISASAACRSINLTGYTKTLKHEGFTLTLTIDSAPEGKAVVFPSSGWTYTFTSATASKITFQGGASATTYTADFGGKSLGALTQQLSNTTATVRLLASLTVSGAFTWTKGTLDTNGKSCILGSFASANTNTRELKLGASIVTLTGSGTAWNMETVTGLTIASNTATLIFGGNEALIKPGGKDFAGASIEATGTGTFQVLGSVTVANFTRKNAAAVGVKVEEGKVLTVTGTLEISGTAGNLVTLVSTSGSVAGSIRKTSGLVSVDFVSIKNILAEGGATFYAGAHSVNEGNTSGWVFEALPAVEGSAKGTVVFSGVAGGLRTRLGQAVGTGAFTGLAGGLRTRSGQATGTAHLGGAAGGQVVVEGQAVGTAGFSGVAGGLIAHLGQALGVGAFHGAAGGLRTRLGQAKGTALFFGVAAGQLVGERPTIRVVREHVPARLVVLVRASDGTIIGRWSQGAANIANVFSNLSKDGQMPGGHTDFSCVLARDPRRSYPDLATFARVELQGAGGEVLWSGTIRQQPQNGDNGTIEVRAVGDKQLLEDSDDVIGPGFIDSDLSKWAGPTTQRRIDLIDKSVDLAADMSLLPGEGEQPGGIGFDFSGAISDESREQSGEAWYDGGGVEIGSIIYFFRAIGGYDTSDETHWLDQVLICGDQRAVTSEGGENHHQNTNASAVTFAAPYGGRTFAALVSKHRTGASGNSMNGIHAWQAPKVIGRQGLALQGTWPSVGFLAKQMIPYIVAGSGLTTKDELLEDDGFVIPQAWFSDPATRMAKLVEVTKYGALDLFVFNDRLLQYRVPGTYGRKWRLAPGSALPRNSGPDGQRTWDRFTVTWQDVDGTTKRASYPGSGAETEDVRLQSTDPRNAAVAQDTPRGKLIAINGKCVGKQAIETAIRFKEEAEQLDQSGEVTISGHVQDTASGAWYPAAHVQPGDWVADAGTSNFRKITGAPYSDDPKSLNCPIGAPPENGLAAIEARYDAKLIERGIS